MPSISVKSNTVAAGIVLAMGIYYHYVANTSESAARKQAKTRAKACCYLPPNLEVWRSPGDNVESEEQIWKDLDEFFREQGFTPWKYTHGGILRSPEEAFPLGSGFAFASGDRAVGDDQVPGSASTLRRFQYTNPLTRIMRSIDGHDVAVRIIAMNSEGHNHLKILRRIATTPQTLLSNNHVLPMFKEVHLQDIVFGVFPLAGSTVNLAFYSWPENSVGDIVDMIMQALEALAFIHSLRIAHRDVFRDNLLIQWHPESLRTMTVPVVRPRVYLIDFEEAVEFPRDCPLEKCLSIGYPLTTSMDPATAYARAVLPELLTGEPYDPFKLDVGQLGTTFKKFKSTIEPIDAILRQMGSPEPQQRLSAQDTLTTLRNVVDSMPAEALLIAPDLEPR